MVAIIKTGSSIRHTFYYNDNKVKDGVADCIMAENYPMALADMSEHHRLNMLLRTAEKNPDVKTNSVHISLNFAPGENLSHDKLREIASEYMDKIGFGKQPYLVYQHYDAGHVHVHIATVKIRPDGSRIDMNNIGKNQSERARKEIEMKHGLVKAEDHKKELFKTKAVSASKVKYGKTETKRAITNVLDTILGTYRYASLPELNAVLNLYNVHAERGSEDSRTYKNKGLVYRILDENKQPIGVPIKASLFYNKPTLKYLEDRFKINDALRQPDKSRLKSAIDFALLHGHQTTLQDMISELRKKGFDTILRQNDEGRIYGITFVDHIKKCVWNGSDLGKQYSAAGILERCKQVPQPIKQVPAEQKNVTTDKKIMTQQGQFTGSDAGSIATGDNGKSILEALMQPEYSGNDLPFQWRKRRKKKKKGQSNGL
ncbi:MAG: relaxase/mobilization nuclease domain-containing protein [Taibaiella sp.]|jgi:hypothetical protein